MTFNLSLSVLNICLGVINGCFAYQAYQRGDTKNFAVSGLIATLSFAVVLL